MDTTNNNNNKNNNNTITTTTTNGIQNALLTSALVSRIRALPLVTDATHLVVQQAPTSLVKSSHTAVNILVDLSTKCVHKIGCTHVLQRVDNKAAEAFEFVENKVPIITKPTTEVVEFVRSQVESTADRLLEYRVISVTAQTANRFAVPPLMKLYGFIRKRYISLKQNNVGESQIHAATDMVAQPTSSDLATVQDAAVEIKGKLGDEGENGTPFAKED